MTNARQLLQEICDAIQEYQDDSDKVVFRAPDGFIERARLEVAGCFDCGCPYGDFHDLFIPNDAWRRISPDGEGNGVLCPTCICKRLEAAGLSEVEGAFMSGPVKTVDRSLMFALRQSENAWERVKGE